MSMRRTIRILSLLLAVSFICTPASVYAKPSGKVVLAAKSQPDTLDPTIASGRVDQWSHHALFDGLLHRNPETLNIEPWLATSIKNINPTTWELNLKEGVKFHNGERFDADSVKFSVERSLDPKMKSPIIKNIDWVKEVQVVSPYKVKIITHAPYPLANERLQNFVVVPPRYIREKGNEYFAKNPIGTGPYKFVKWLAGQYIEYEANENYWREAPSIKTIIFKTVPDDSTRIAELLSGSSDIIFDLLPDQVAAIEKSAHTKVESAPSLRVAYVAFDAVGKGEKGPFMDKRVRQAVNYGVDINLIIKHTMLGYGDRTATAANNMVFGCDPTMQPYPYDPEKAKKLMVEAGYPNGFECTFYGYGGRFFNARQVMEAIMGYLQKNLNIKTVPKWYDTWPTYGQLIRAGKATPMHMGTWGSYSIFDAEGLYPYLMHKDGVQAYWYTPETDKMIEEAGATIKQERRKEIYYKLQRIVKEEAPWLFMWGQIDLIGINKRIDWKPSKDEIVRFYDIKLKK